ncbi:MAG: SIS domain-containing protein [Armatimonadota bacterium]|nr:SIS domain-containing protein [Armatimonadota bacterium]
MEPSRYINSLADALLRLPGEALARVEEVLFQAWRQGRTIFIAGNGGSSSTASHLANDLNKGAAVPGWPRFRAIALTDNVPLITAWANDTSYDRIFVEQMANFLRPGDVFVAISGSGNSANIVAALRWARKAGAVTVGLTGGDGGELQGLADVSVVVPTDVMEQIEDMHLVIAHALCTSLRARIRNGAGTVAAAGTS